MQKLKDWEHLCWLGCGNLIYMYILGSDLATSIKIKILKLRAISFLRMHPLEIKAPVLKDIYVQKQR